MSSLYSPETINTNIKEYSILRVAACNVCTMGIERNDIATSIQRYASFGIAQNNRGRFIRLLMDLRSQC